MSYIEPNSTINFLKGVPFDQRNTTNFSSLTSQVDYMTGRIHKAVTKYTYVKEGVVRVEIPYTDIIQCNYLMYRNNGFENKWFYAYIDKFEMISNKACDVYFTIDDMQTWLFQMNLKDCFVEREHVSNDTIGLHTLDEGVALGDYVTNESFTKYFNDFWICVGSTVELKDTTFPPIGGYIYGGIYSGISWYCFDMDTATWVLPVLMTALATANKSDAIISVFMLPKEVVSTAQNDGGYLQPPREETTFNLYKPNNVNGYTPKNKKLLTHPYVNLVISKQQGNANILKYEYFDLEVLLGVRGGIQPNSRIVMYPKNYKGMNVNLNESINLGDYPQCATQNNLYAQWLANQTARYSNEVGTHLRNMATGATLGAMTGNPLMAVGGGLISGVGSMINSYTSMQTEREINSAVPNSVSGTVGNGNLNITLGRYGFLLEQKSIRREYAEIIDKFFTMYGYKVNTVKTPNINSRPSFNYVKTNGCVMTGNIPKPSIERMKAQFNDGITFWHSPSNVGNYDANNSI